MSPRIGIRREDKSEWERRVPLVPDDVRTLAHAGLDVVVEPSERRIFDGTLYEAAGATLGSVSECPVVFGVKEIPIATFQPGATYVFFSHTIKGQPENMEMLRALMARGCQLIDYERIVDASGRRLIFFGWYAGVAGMVETLRAYGRRLQLNGAQNPFARIGQPLEYASIDDIRAWLGDVGAAIEAGLPEALLPVRVAVTGYGNVSQGAQSMLDELPVIEVAPRELSEIDADTEGAGTHVFKAVFKEADLVEHREGGSFSLDDYYSHPQRYRGVFERYLPHLSMLVNCIYWDERYPRLVTREYLQTQWQGTPLAVIGDISCDIDGSIEVTTKATEPGDPNYVYEPARDRIVAGEDGDGPVIMAVDILPAELPRDASVHFSHVLKPYVDAIARADYTVPFASLQLPDAVKSALVLHRGELTPDYAYMKEFL